MGVDGGIRGVIDTGLLDVVAVEGRAWVVYADFSLLVLVGFADVH